MRYALVLCVSFMLFGCATSPLNQCIEEAVELYNDLCAEARPCEEYDAENCNDEAADRRGSANLLIDMHYEGVKCAAETIRLCAEVKP